jgi:CHASE3 domain sensor protein
MHQPIAAGRLVDFKEDSFYDPKTNKAYNGVYVTAYISEGAEDTWKKVLDGTLSGFSIGGNITDQETEFNKDYGKTVRIIKAYDLVELSLVDSPANQLANIFSIVKADDGMVMKGMAADTQLENIFFCETDEIAKNSASDTLDCLQCGNAMANIGFVEKGQDEAYKTASAVTDFLRQKEATVNTTAHGEGGVIMTDEIKKNDDATTEEVVEAPAETVEEVTAEAAKTEEVVNEVSVEPDFEKLFDDLKGSVHDSLESSKETVQKAVESVEARVKEVSEAFDTKASELEKSLTELSEKFDSIRTEREEVTKRLEVLEKSTAIKKSGEVEAAPETKVQKGIWGGALFSRED